MEAVFISTAGHVDQDFDVVVGQNLDFFTHADGTKRTRMRAQVFFRVFFSGQTKLFAVQRVFDFGFVNLVIAAHQYQYRHCFFFIHLSHVQHRLDDLTAFQPQTFGCLINAVRTWRSLFLQFSRISRLLDADKLARGFFQVGSIDSIRVGNRIFTNLSWCREFLGVFAPHRTRISQDHLVVQANLVEDIAVCLSLQTVCLIQTSLISRERVAIQHFEFLTPQNAIAWPILITELVLQLVDDQWQLLI